MEKMTTDKIKEMKKNGESMGCMCCLGRLDDGKHEYDKSVEVFYCPVLDE